ncbi:hypothetical protein [Escherichia coli]|uniref:hypothetical protein n=1 Tax=Escherichia coli TaxID=562 RepID=UPI0020911DB7|nr:hypothetical protein [Escherichia coli]MCO4902615.1 hypothetical protein [Escherichia coli]
MFRYTLSDALKWASFCKDYNPIHFFYTSKNRRPVVHGMRVALDIKKHILSNSKEFSEDKKYLNISVRFKNPVYYNNDYMLSPVSASDCIKFNLIDDDNNTAIETIITASDSYDVNAPGNSLLINDICYSNYFKSFFLKFDQMKGVGFWDSLLFCVAISSLKEPSILIDYLENSLVNSTLIHTHQYLTYKKSFIDTFEFSDKNITPHIKVWRNHLIKYTDNEFIISISACLYTVEPVMISEIILKVVKGDCYER